MCFHVDPALLLKVHNQESRQQSLIKSAEALTDQRNMLCWIKHGKSLIFNSADNFIVN